MVVVKDTKINVTITYETVDEMVEDCVTDEIVEEWLNEIYGYQEVGSFKFGGGTILRNCLDESAWNDYVNDFIMSEVEFIEDQLAGNGECDWYDLYITDPNYAEEEEEE